MANALYDLGRESFLKGEISWSADNIKTVLVDTATYTVDFANHQFLSDIPAGERVATSANLTTKTTTAGVADADDVLYTAVEGDQSEALVVYQDTAVASTSRLIAYIDTAGGLPVTPNGGDIAITWDTGANKIFKL
jgi:phage tail sheath gpL-like